MNDHSPRPDAEAQDPKGNAHLQGVWPTVPVGQAKALILFYDVPESPSPEQCAYIDAFRAVSSYLMTETFGAYGPCPTFFDFFHRRARSSG